MQNSKGRLMIFSFDAMNAIDFDLISEIDLFKDFMDNGAYVRSVKSVYPSLTYPAHTSIITSCYPDRHGIVNNLIAREEDLFRPDWYWYKKDIKVKTMYDYLEEYKYSNSAFFYPVMAGEKRGIVLPEIFDTKGGSNASKLLKEAPVSLIPSLVKHRKKLNGLSQPELDDFLFSVAYDTYKKKKPENCFIHLTELDTKRHNLGLKGEHVLESYLSMASKVQKMIDLTKELGTYDDTTFIILGDHGGAPTLNDISLNRLFLDNDLLKVRDDGVYDAKCYQMEAGGSAHIYLNDKAYEGTLFELLIKGRDEGYIKEIYEAKEAKHKFNLAGDFSYVVEAADNHQFVNKITDNVVTYHDETKPDHQLNHGQNPTNPLLRTMLFMKGRGVKKQAMLDTCHLVDEGCTFLRILNIEMKDVDGRVLKELLD